MWLTPKIVPGVPKTYRRQINMLQLPCTDACMVVGGGLGLGLLHSYIGSMMPTMGHLTEATPRFHA